MSKSNDKTHSINSIEEACAGNSSKAAPVIEIPKVATFEPFVDADVVAVYLGIERKTVVNRARNKLMSSYPFSGDQRITYKFRLSEVDADMARLRVPPADLRTSKPKKRKEA